MIRLRNAHTLALAIALFLPLLGEAQMVVRGGGRASRPSVVRPPSSLPPIRMGSLPQRSAPVILRDRGYYNRGRTFGGRPVSSCYSGSYWCGGVNIYRPPLVRSSHTHVHVHRTYVGWPWWYMVPIVLYDAPVYTTFWSPGPARVWSPTSKDSQPPAPPADPANSRMLTIGTGADGGGGVMRIENVSDSVARVTWLGTTRPIRQARLFLADSVQQALRGALIDQETPSALLKFSDFATRVRYIGLTITLANGAIETTLIPYDPRTARQP
jgi:hypothetical protein